MKKILKFSGIAAFAIALVAFILMMSTNAITYHLDAGALGSTDFAYSGIQGIFGGEVKGSIGGMTFTAGSIAATWSAVIAFILMIAAMLILLAGFILPLLKIHALDKVAGVLNLVAVIALVVAGIFIFIETPCFMGANGVESYDGWTLGAGWIVAGILAILGGIVAIVPAAFDFISKKR